MPEKLRDTSRFTILCSIVNTEIGRALIDLGASISLLPYSLFKKLDIGKLECIPMTIHLADSSSKVPKGILENILVQVEDFTYPADFVVMDMDDDDYVSIILGRPFMSTAQAVVDVYSGNYKTLFRR